MASIGPIQGGFMEKTLILIKPDAVEKKLIGKILRLYEVNGLTIDALMMRRPTMDLLQDHYAEHLERDFYPELTAFMMSGPVVAAVISGPDAVEMVRELHGATNPQKARVGTIRKLYGTSVQRNAVHGSADLNEATREIDIWFGADD
jgi:nucleoside-diphosphate kinase